MARGITIEFGLHEDHAQFVSDNWKLCIDRPLTSEQLTSVAVLLAANEHLYDEKGREFSLPQTMWCIQQVAPEVVPLAWEHKPIYVKVTSLGLPWKIYEMIAISFAEAETEARRLWHEQFPFGERATIVSVKLAAKKDLKKAVQVKENS